MDRRTLATAAAIGALSLLVVATPAGAGHTLTVCPDGSCDHTTIQGALDEADPGTTITVAPGTYEESLDVSVPGVTITGPTDPTVDHRDYEVLGLVDLGGTYLIPIERVVFVDPPGSKPAFDVRADDVTLRNASFEGRNNRVKGADNVTLESVVIEGRPHGLNVASARVSVTNSTLVAGTSGTGNAAKLHGAGTDGSRLRNNTIAEFDNGPILNGVQNVSFVENEVNDMDQFGLLAVSKGRVVKDVTVDDNTFRDSTFGLLLHENWADGSPSAIYGVDARFNRFEDVPHGVLGLRTHADGDGPVIAGPVESVDATHNWWDAPTGPAPATGQFALRATAGQNAPVASAGGNVDTLPFCLEPVCRTQEVLHHRGVHPHLPPVTGPGPG